MTLNMDVVRETIHRALAEDIGHSDITTAAIVPAEQQGKAVLLAKADGVIAGLPVMQEVFSTCDAALVCDTLVPEGTCVAPGMELAIITGSLASIITAERTALNFLMRMSGIATLTAKFVEAVKGTAAKVVDTRKTAPGLRILDKYAVRIGGGHNHRFGLYDGILIKENHIAAAGSITAAVEKVRKSAHHLIKIEVEATTRQEAEEAISAGVDAVLLDNMEPALMAECVQFVAESALTEASGGVNLSSVRAIAATGVDIISIGHLTHSAPALDLSLEVK